MTYLLDTHSFLWAAFSPRQLSRKAHGILSDPAQDVAVSAVSFWEISLKYALGKIVLEHVLPGDLPAAAREMGYDLLPLGVDEASSFHQLSRGEHRDPFDRMLAWQAINRGWVLISKDPALAAYKADGLKVLW